MILWAGWGALAGALLAVVACQFWLIPSAVGDVDRRCRDLESIVIHGGRAAGVTTHTTQVEPRTNVPRIAPPNPPLPE